ncbi:hypothetical protein [Oenococcus oeni]
MIEFWIVLFQVMSTSSLGFRLGFLRMFAVMFVDVFWSLKAIKLETIGQL